MYWEMVDAACRPVTYDGVPPPYEVGGVVPPDEAVEPPDAAGAPPDEADEPPDEADERLSGAESLTSFEDIRLPGECVGCLSSHHQSTLLQRTLMLSHLR
jgi:hypothetical protein